MGRAAGLEEATGQATAQAWWVGGWVGCVVVRRVALRTACFVSCVRVCALVLTQLRSRFLALTRHEFLFLPLPIPILFSAARYRAEGVSNRKTMKRMHEMI